MRALASFILFVGGVGYVHGQFVGVCNMTAYSKMMEPCQTNFVSSLQKNPKSNCSIELDGLRGCMESVIKSCFTQPLNNMVLKFMLVKLVTKDLFCDKAGLMFPNVVDNTTLSCKLTTSEYVSKINSCSNKTYKMWKENRADRAICGEYANAKKCVRQVIDNYECVPSGELVDAINASLGKYNPFCPNGEDPALIKAGSGRVIAKSAITIFASFSVILMGLL